MRCHGKADGALALTIALALAVALPARVAQAGALVFEANAGQAAADVRFVARGPGQFAELRDGSARIAVAAGGDRLAVVDLRLDGARRGLAPRARSELPGRAHFLRDADPARHVTDVPMYDGVVYADAYPGIDLVWHGDGGALEHDFVVAPGADAGRIALRFDGARGVRVDGEGALRMSVGPDEVVFRPPLAYQQVGEARVDVPVRYAVARDGRIGFRLGRYDRRAPLTIDPVLALSSSLWGNAAGVALDAAGNIYVVGSTWSSDLPATGGYATQQQGTQDAYVAKLDPQGRSVVWATYLGARRATSVGLAIAVDASGVYVSGTTTSTSFPVTPGAYASAGGTFVTKLKPAGNALAYSMLFGAPVAAIAVHADGSLALTGTAPTLATTAGAFQPVKPAASSPYVARLNASGTAMTYATWLGGSAADEARGIAVDGAGNAYVVGTARSSNFPVRNALRPGLSGASDAFVAKVNPSGTALVYSTYLGGSADERAFGVAVDAAGRAGVVGWTKSFDFPATAGAFQTRMGGSLTGLSNAYVAWLDPSGSALAWASYLGGGWCVVTCFGLFGPDEGVDVATSIAVDAAGFTYVGGYATSARFPLADAVQATGLGGDVQRVPFVARFRPGGARLAYSTVLGTATSTSMLGQVASDGAGGVVAVGTTPGAPFPLTASAVFGGGNAFVLRLATSALFPTRLSAVPNPAARGQAVTLTAEADAAVAGVVTFRDGAATLGTAPVVNGMATLGVSLAPGIHRITAVNNADGKVSPTTFTVVNGQ